MPVERGYDSQVGPAAPTPAPRADPNAFGASVGAGLEAVGDSLHRLDTDSQAAGFSAKFAQLREAADNASVDARRNADAGGAGHAEKMKDWWDAQSAGMLDGIKDRRLLRSAQAQLAEFGARFNSSEYQWQLGQQAGKIVADKAQERDTAANRAYRMSDPKAFAEELSLGRQSIEDLQGVSADVKDKLIREHDATVSVGFLNGMKDRDPASVAKVLNTGAFDDILSAAQMEHLRNAAEVAVRRNDAAAKADAAHQLNLLKKDLAARKAELNTGAGTPQDWFNLANSYESIGEKAFAIEARAQGDGKAAVAGNVGEMPAQLDAKIAALTAKQHGGGLTPKEASTLTGLTSLRDQTVSRLGQPGGALLQYQYASGKSIAPLDPTDPASLRARALQAQAAAASVGRVSPEPLLHNELPIFRDLVSGGPQKKLQALQMIQGFGDPQVIRAAAAQVAGADDGAFRIASQLPISIARDVLQGSETIKSGPQVWNEARARADFNKWYGRTLSMVGGSYRSDIFDAAKSFYGERAVQGGEQTYNPGRFAEAIETVIGRMPDPNGATGGIARHSQGIVLVPQGMKPDALLQRFARASAEDYARASDAKVPHWSDGTALTRTELVRTLPTAIDGAGHYGFRGPGGKLIETSPGVPYVVDINRLAR